MSLVRATASSSLKVSCYLLEPKDLGIETFAAPDDEFFAYYHPKQPETLETALRELHNYVVEEGPFDAVLAFSQGCALAASFIVRNQAARLLPHFKFAVFFSGGPACSVEQQGGRLFEQGDATIDGFITTPTLHVWGANDHHNPKDNRLLGEQCSNDTKSIFVHQGEHEIPGSGKTDAVVEITHRIRRLFC
ncbi:uncharacterized protein BP5553_07132 [Venustampulla echinocandica]|uniref:Serine hydrolase domain-containing protein n=1 Tax=Venustampulla echinocandica TaxID=2656787 RepID=A0A370TIL1_9HELO|nr:uncharacterized protein BP5553_07132 [Venustampulla echinocandica]RDL35201.1 hypothetical protein BP5553_07132 [Venustampulla echinocandica]